MARRLDSMCILLQTWDVNKAAPESLGGPFNLMLASNAVHTCDNMAGRTPSCLSPVSSLTQYPRRAASVGAHTC